MIHDLAAEPTTLMVRIDSQVVHPASVSFIATHNRCYNPSFSHADEKQFWVYAHLSRNILRWTIERRNQITFFPQGNHLVLIPGRILPDYHIVLVKQKAGTWGNVHNKSARARDGNTNGFRMASNVAWTDAPTDRPHSESDTRPARAEVLVSRRKRETAVYDLTLIRGRRLATCGSHISR